MDLFFYLIFVVGLFHFKWYIPYQHPMAVHQDHDCNQIILSELCIQISEIRWHCYVSNYFYHHLLIFRALEFCCRCLIWPSPVFLISFEEELVCSENFMLPLSNFLVSLQSSRCSKKYWYPLYNYGQKASTCVNIYCIPHLFEPYFWNNLLIPKTAAQCLDSWHVE